VGAGFLLSGQYILTCAHVVAQALEIPETSENPGEPEIEVDFPLVEPVKKQKTKLSFWLPAQSLSGNPPEKGEDIAILELLPLENQPPEENRPLREVEFAPLSIKGEQALWEHPFRVFGFPQGHANGVWAKGELSGEQASGWIQMGAVTVPGYQIEPGFSGTPVWDKELGAVVGMITAAERKRQEVKAAFMIPTEKLEKWIPSEFLSGCQKVNQLTEFNPDFQQIIYAFEQGDIVPFLGAGINLCDYPQRFNLIKLASILIERYKVGNTLVGLPRLGIPYPVCPLPTQESSWPPPKGCPFYEKTASEESLLALSNEQRLVFAKVNLRLMSQYVRFVWGDDVKGFYDELEKRWDDCFSPGKKEQSPDRFPLRRVHDFFATLPQKMIDKRYRNFPYKLIVTTNFDESLEEAFEAAEQPYDVIFYLAEEKENGEQANQGRFVHRKYRGETSVLTSGLETTPNFGKHPIILKLFGTWGREFVITEDHHITYLLKPDFENALPLDLRTHLKNSKNLFLGYSLYDSDLLTVLYRIWQNQPLKKSKEFDPPSWIVHQSPVLEIQGGSLEGRLWKNKKVELIQSSLADFITNLEMGIESLKNKN
jgi:V8-like Glu-specific endopeptidase